MFYLDLKEFIEWMVVGAVHFQFAVNVQISVWFPTISGADMSHT
jgi:hypothetical protein